VFDLPQGYLKVPNPNDANLEVYLNRITPKISKPVRHAITQKD